MSQDVRPERHVMLSPRPWQEPNVKHKIGEMSGGMVFALCPFDTGYSVDHERVIPITDAEEYRWCGHCKRMLGVDLDTNARLYDFEAA